MFFLQTINHNDQLANKKIEFGYILEKNVLIKLTPRRAGNRRAIIVMMRIHTAVTYFLWGLSEGSSSYKVATFVSTSTNTVSRPMFTVIRKNRWPIWQSLKTESYFHFLNERSGY